MSDKQINDGGPAFPVWELNGKGQLEMTGFAERQPINLMPTNKGTAKAPKSRTGSAIPFMNKEGHVMHLSPEMELRDLLKIGVVEIRLAKPDTPLREGEWRDASPDALQNAERTNPGGDSRRG